MGLAHCMAASVEDCFEMSTCCLCIDCRFITVICPHSMMVLPVHLWRIYTDPCQLLPNSLRVAHCELAVINSVMVSTQYWQDTTMEQLQLGHDLDSWELHSTGITCIKKLACRSLDTQACIIWDTSLISLWRKQVVAEVGMTSLPQCVYAMQVGSIWIQHRASLKWQPEWPTTCAGLILFQAWSA